MFGLGFGEILVIAIVLLVVVGPRELPRLLRSMGRGINKLRTMSTELRAQSGIDEILREEGLQEDLDAIRSLSRGRVIDALVNPPPRRGLPDGPPPADAAYAEPLAGEAAPPQAPAPPADGDGAAPPPRPGGPGGSEAEP